MEYNYYPPQAGLPPPPPVGNQQQHCSQIQMMPNSVMAPHESPIPQQQHQMMRQSLTPGQQPPMMSQQQPPPPMQQQTPPIHQQQTPPMHQQQQQMMHQTMPPQSQTYHQLPPHPPTPLSASPIHPGSIHSNHSSQTNLSLQQPPSRPSTGPPPPMQHVQPGPPPGMPPHHHQQQHHHHHMGGPPLGPPQMNYNGLQPGPPMHPHHHNSRAPPGPPSLQPGMPPGPHPGPPPSAGYGVTPPPSGPPPPHQMQHHHHHHPPPHHMAPQPPQPQMHHPQMHHNPHHIPQTASTHQMHPMHPSMDRHGSPFYQNIPQTEYRIIELNKRLQNRPRLRGPISPLPSSIIGPTDDTFWWERFACDFFDDNSTLTIRVPDEKQPTEYTIGRTLIPRFFKTYFDGGVSDFSIKLHHTEELNHPTNPNLVMLKCDHTDITTKNVFRHQSNGMPTYVVVHTEGQLTLEFCSNGMLDTLLIKSWRFHTRQCHEFIDRSMTVGGMPDAYLIEPVTRHGLTKRTINYLKMCMIMEPMQDLMLHNRQTNLEPKACLRHLLLNRFNVKSAVEEKKQKRKRGTRTANTGATKKSKANNSMNMVKNNMSFNNNNIMSPANMGGGVPNLPLASQDVMVVGEPSMLGAEFGDENERRITRLENSQFDPSTMNPNINNNNSSNNINNNNNCNGGAKMMNQQQSQPNCGTPPNNSNGNNNIGQMAPQDQLSNCGTPTTPNNGIGRMTPQESNCGPAAPHTPNNIGGHQMAPQDQQQLQSNQQQQQQPPPPVSHQIQQQQQQQQPPPPLQPIQPHQQDLDLSSSQ